MEASSEMDLKRILRLVYRKKKLFFFSTVLVTTAVVVAAYLLPKEYEAKSVIYIERNVLNELIKDVTVTASLEEKIRGLSVVMKSRGLIQKVMGDLNLDVTKKSSEEMEGAISNFQERTMIEMEIDETTRKNMDLFVVSYTDSNPRLASDYVNALIRRYIEENVSFKRAAAFGASQFLLDQLSAFKAKLDKIETSITRHRREKPTAQNEVPLIDVLEPLLRKKEELLLQYTENHPEVVKITGEIELLKQQMKSGAPGPDMALLDLERERDTTKKIYEDLLATLRKSEVSTEIEVQDKADAFRILDPAIEPSKPVSPNMPRMILLALMVGTGAGMGLLLLTDVTDSSVKSVDTVKKMGLPVLAVIATMKTDQETASAQRTDRRLYTAAAVYFLSLLLIAGMEIMGIKAVDKFVQGTRVEIGKTVKKILGADPAAAAAPRLLSRE